MIKLIILSLSLVIFSTLAQASLDPVCDEKCDRTMLDLAMHWSGAQSGVGEVGPTAVRRITSITLESRYKNVWFLGLDMLTETLGSENHSLRAQAMMAIGALAAMSPNNPAVAFKSIESLESVLKNKTLKLRIHAINSITNLAILNPSAEIKERALKALEITNDAWLDKTSDHSELSSEIISDACVDKISDLLRLSSERISETIKAGKRSFRIDG